MIRGIGSSLTAMAWEQNRTDVIAGNVANVNTEGFKRSVAVGASFGDLLLRRLGDQNSPDGAQPVVGPLGFGANLETISVDQAPGVISKSEGPFDVALDGPGEFIFQGPAGPGYTRRGAFQRDSTGLLTTADGYPVLVNGAPAGAGAATLEIAADGVVVADGTAVGRLDLRGAGATQIVVGSLEHSNVDLAQEMTDLITAMRSYQANQRAMQMQDETLGKAVSELGRI